MALEQSALGSPCHSNRSKHGWAYGTELMWIRKRLARQWVSCYVKLARAGNEWQLVKGPMGATIATLLDTDVRPVHPIKWLNKDGQSMIEPLADEGAFIHKVLSTFERRLTDKIRTEAADHHNGAGLQRGKPNMSIAGKVHKQLIRKGKHDEARALESIVTAKVWNEERRTQTKVQTEEGQHNSCDG